MDIKSINFNKQDYAYEIKYFDGKDTLVLSTNEEPLNSLRIEISALKEALGKYLDIGEDWHITLKGVTFNKDPSFKVGVEQTSTFPPRSYGVSTKVWQINPAEHNPGEARQSVMLHTETLISEIEKYIKGERAQQLLPFGSSADEAGENI